MHRVITSILLIVLGLLYAFIVWLGHTRGELPFQKFSAPGPNRERNPGKFYFHIAVYCIAAVGFTLWGLAMLVGFAKPLPWR